MMRHASVNSEHVDKCVEQARSENAHTDQLQIEAENRDDLS